MAQRLPIVYVRGFAGNTSGIDAAVDDPLYGFNDGSVHVRVGRSGDPLFYQFESPLLRLITDHDYRLIVEGGQLDWLKAQRDGQVPPASVWIHRFYDVSASTFGEKPREFTPERAATDLLALIELLQRKTGAPRVHLVAHSMGGLICRCLLQKIIPEREGRSGRQSTDFVERLFTYATPHGGIAFDIGFGLLERLRDEFGIGGGEIFGPERMYQYLTPGAGGRPPQGWEARLVPDSDFPRDRIFSLVGTNPSDYGVAKGLSSKAVGAKSDGLVQIENAYVPAAKFAYVHRSHSGRYGIVNSEEGYQNLRRFLLGDLEVNAELVRLQLPETQAGRDVVWQAEAELAVRGLPILLHQAVARHHCPINLELPKGTADNPVPLVTTFLLADASQRPAADEPARYSLHLRVLSLRERSGGLFDFGDHLESTADFDDLLIVDVGTVDGSLAAWAAWNSELSVPLRDYAPSGEPLGDEDPRAGLWVTEVPLPASARGFLGAEAAVRLSVSDRGQQGRAGLADATPATGAPRRARGGGGPAASPPAPRPARGNVLTRAVRRLFRRG